jgi:uncharacterized protein (TIGR02145 family)
MISGLLNFINFSGMDDIISTPKKIPLFHAVLFLLITLFLFEPFFLGAQVNKDSHYSLPLSHYGRELVPWFSNRKLMGYHPDSAFIRYSSETHQTSCNNTSPWFHYNPLPDNPLTSSSMCQNSDFSLGNFTNWSGCYGLWCNNGSGSRCTGLYIPFNPPCSNPNMPWNNVPTGGHFSIQTPGFDPCISTLNRVFPGDSYSALIGNRVCTSNNAGGYVDQLTYKIVYDTSNSFFIYRCAVVLADITDSSHNTPNRRPRFTFEIQHDATKTIIDSVCGYYDLYPGDPITVWQNGPNSYVWQDWSTIGIDFNVLNGVTPGEVLDIVFTVHGCAFTAHTGYAYISAVCGSMNIAVTGCEGSGTVTLTGPPGFAQYQWTGPYCPTCPPNPPTYSGNPITLTAAQGAVTGNTFKLNLTALNGCQVNNIQQNIAFTNIAAGFTVTNNCAQKPTTFTDTSRISHNAITNWRWFFGDPASGSSDSSHLQNPVHTFNSAGTFNVMLIAYSTEGCADAAVKSIFIDTLPINTNALRRQRICNNTPTNITLTSTVSNTLYTWTTTSSSPSISGYSDNTTTPSIFINQTLTNSVNQLDSVIYHFIPHSSTCTGTPFDFTVVVCLVPNLLTTPLSKSVCDSVNSNILLTSNVDSTRFTWTCTTNPGSHLSGYSDYTVLPGIMNINQVVYNSGNNVDTVHYHIQGNAYGCDGPLFDYRLAVYPMPTLTNAPLNSVICSKSYTAITLTSNVTGTLFTWTCTASGPGITGYTNNSVPSASLNQQLFNTTILPGTVTYYITPHANNCDGHIYTYIVTVNPLPSVTNTVNPSICSSGNPEITLLSNIPNPTFSWTASGSSGNVTGYSNSSGPVISQVLVNSGLSDETVTYTVTATANGCSGSSSDIRVTVFPVPDVYFKTLQPVICSAQSDSITILSHVPGSTFTWTASGTSGNVNGYSAGSGSYIVQTLNNTGINIEKVFYVATPTANSCPGINNRDTITVNPVPVVTYTLCHDNITTLGSQHIRLTGGIPIGGSYTGSGVSGGFFNPAIAGIGNHTITYSYSNYLGCNRTATQSITVVNNPVFFCGTNLIDIRDGQSYPTVKLGTRCWMAANLNFGNDIPSASMQRDNCINEKYCYQDNLANCASYGGLYQWDEMMRYDNTPAAQGFCPPGWHVPIENEWNALFAIYVGNGFAGEPLKYSGYSGFNAPISGVRFDNVDWDFSGFAIMIWSSTEEIQYHAWAHGMNYYNPSVSYYPSSKMNALAVRCIQD